MIVERSRRSETIKDLLDDDGYEPSNNGNPETTNNDQGDSSKRINALDYVNADYPLLPPPRSRILDSIELVKNRTRRYSMF